MIKDFTAEVLRTLDDHMATLTGQLIGSSTDHDLIRGRIQGLRSARSSVVELDAKFGGEDE